MLAARAGDVGLSAYVRTQLFGGGKRARVPRQPQSNSAEAAKILSLLGSSEILKSLNELAYAAKLGALPVTPETLALIEEACRAVLAMREDLIAALGLRGDL